MAKKWVASEMAATPYRLLVHLSERKNFFGIEVVNFTTDADDPALYFAKVKSALELIAVHQPKRLQRIRRDLKFIVVYKQAGASYWPFLRACALTPRALTTSDAEEVALAIVHEATHARICALGIDYDVERRARIERLCVNEEISLAHHLVAGSQRAERLGLELKKPWWSDEDLRKYKIKRMEMNLPPRIARWFIGRLPPL